eukprot:12216605-Alexandrium_andersonii.AAC.1
MLRRARLQAAGFRGLGRGRTDGEGVAAASCAECDAGAPCKRRKITQNGVSKTGHGLILDCAGGVRSVTATQKLAQNVVTDYGNRGDM